MTTMRGGAGAARILGAAATVVLAVVLSAVPAAASQSGSAGYDKPTWWPKFEAISQPGFRATQAPATTSVTVGPNVDVSREPGPQSETSIAIDPSAPTRVVAGSNEIARLPMRGYFSDDGGGTWGAVDLPLPPALNATGVDFGSDPGVAFDTRGNVYYSYIVVFFNRGFDAITGTEMAVARSADGGRSWTPTFFNFNSGTGRFNDKPMIAVDTNALSPHRDTVYVAWDNASLNQGKSSGNDVILVSHSTDAGASFSVPAVASATKAGPRAVIGADPFVAPDGSLFVAWHDSTNGRLVESESLDGGTSFTAERTIASTSIAFDIAIPAMATRRALLYPACGADSSAGAHRGTLYCSWMDLTASNGRDVFVARSSDGIAWSAPLRVNDDATQVANDQFNQWLAVDASDGSVDVSWNDTRLDPRHLSTDIFMARSVDGGQSFGANVRVTSAPTDETCCGADLGNQYGDYEGLAALGGVIRPVWTDRRAAVADLDEEVFTATLTVV